MSLSLSRLIVALFVLSSLLLIPNSAWSEDGTSSNKDFIERRYVYEEVSMEAFAKLYWTLSRLDINSDIYIDNYMKITQCDVYKDYFSNEFEWREVRASARDYIQQNKRTFPIRYQFTQPLRLADYDFNTQKFQIVEDYQINAGRRFEVKASLSRDPICGKTGPIIGYPRALMLELSRPLTLKSFYVDPVLAQEYISKKLEKFRKLKPNRQNDYYLYEMRDAYIVMKVKMFSSQGQARTSDGYWLAHILGVLEGYEIYGDPEKQMLLYKKDLIRRRRRSQIQMEQKLKEQYEQQKSAEPAAETSAE